MEEASVRNTTALNEVISWAGYADSVDKLTFLKQFCTTLSQQEVSHLKKILGHITYRPDCKKRKWVGISWEEAKKRKAQSELKPSLDELQPFVDDLQPSVDELQPSLDELQPSKPTSVPSKIIVSSVPRPKLIPKPWWRNIYKENYLALDVEKVGVIITSGHWQRGAKVAAVNTMYTTVVKKDIYHKPGSFNTHPIVVKISGIRSHDLVNGEPFSDVLKHLREIFKNKMVITVSGQQDFVSLDIDRDDYQDTFDLQAFHRRPHPSSNNSEDTQPMGLRDMYFHYFKEDCQFTLPHDCVEDAKNTMKIFLEGYIPFKLQHGVPYLRGNVEGVDFTNTPNLRKFQEQGKFYCKPTDEFKKGCLCQYCIRYKK